MIRSKGRTKLGSKPNKATAEAIGRKQWKALDDWAAESPAVEVSLATFKEWAPVLAQLLTLRGSPLRRSLIAMERAAHIAPVVLERGLQLLFEGSNEQIANWRREHLVPSFNRKHVEITAMCIDCGQMFARHDKRDAYCSLGCSSRARNRGIKRPGANQREKNKATRHAEKCLTCIAGKECPTSRTLWERILADPPPTDAMSHQSPTDVTPECAEGMNARVRSGRRPAAE